MPAAPHAPSSAGPFARRQVGVLARRPYPFWSDVQRGCGECQVPTPSLRCRSRTYFTGSTGRSREGLPAAGGASSVMGSFLFSYIMIRRTR